MDIIDIYLQNAPSYQNAIDIFKGEWSSKFPENSALEAGQSPLFEDGRITWAAEKFGGFKGKSILELGPLEGGHTYMLEREGADSITSIEANTRAYLKCLITKEILGLRRCNFLAGDFIKFLRSNQQRFDICIASGVLYHMSNPAELIALISKLTNHLFIWTHYYDNAVFAQKINLQYRMASGVLSNYDNFQYTVYRQDYQDALGWAGFCGAGSSFSHWMSRKEIISCCNYFGFDKIEVGFDHPDHPNGPSFAIAATKTLGL